MLVRESFCMLLLCARQHVVRMSLPPHIIEILSPNGLKTYELCATLGKRLEFSLGLRIMVTVPVFKFLRRSLDVSKARTCINAIWVVLNSPAR